MRPFLFSIGSSRIPSFFFFIMVGVLLFTFYCYWLAKRRGLSPDAVLDLGMIGMVSGILGARIFHILVEAPWYYWEKPFRVLEFWRGGFVSWGGFIAVLLTLFIYLRIKKLSMGRYFDLIAAGSPLLKLSIRFACLLTGCCYGHPTNVPWAITFTDPASTAYYYYPNTPLHPSQVYSMIQAGLLFLFINWFYKKHQEEPGTTACMLVLGWTLPRFFLEMFRGDADRGLYFNNLLSTGQVTGVILALLALVTYVRLRKYYKTARPS